MTKKHIIGDKQSFAIEYMAVKTDPYLVGNCCLWIGGLRVGCFDDEATLYSIVSQLYEHVTRLKKHDYAPFNSVSDEEAYDLIFGGQMEIENSHCLLHLSETFDDFHFACINNNGSAKFLWKLDKEPYADYPDYGHDLHVYELPIDTLEGVVQDFYSDVKFLLNQRNYS